MGAKLPEVGEFWLMHSLQSRVKIIGVSDKKNECCVQYPGGSLFVYQVESLTEKATYLPWCKSFTDIEPPKPEMETVLFHEVVTSGGEMIFKRRMWTSDIPTGRTETRELPKR